MTTTKESMKVIAGGLDMIINTYYFEAVLSEERRQGVIADELAYQEDSKDEGGGRSFRSRDVRLIVVLNILLVIACIILTIYCFSKGMKGYGVFMVAFAFFFAAWGRKFSRSKKK